MLEILINCVKKSACGGIENVLWFFAVAFEKTLINWYAVI